MNVLGTRWLPHLERALTALLKNYQGIHAHLDDTAVDRRGSADMQGRATNIVKKLEKFFVVGVLSKVSLLFQRDGITLALPKGGLEVARLEVTAMVARPATKLQDFLNAVGNNTSYQNVDLSSRPNDINRLAENIANSLLELIDKGSIAWWTIPFSLLQISLTPRTGLKTITSLPHGEDHVEELKIHYQPLSKITVTLMQSPMSG